MAFELGLAMEERVTSLFQPDTLLPEQYLDTYRRKLYLEPEKKLMLALLEDGVACFRKYLFSRDSKGKALFREAENWITEEGNETVFSFECICEALGLDPSYLRHGLSAWKGHALAAQNHTKAVKPLPRSRHALRTGRRAGRLRPRLKRVVNR